MGGATPHPDWHASGAEYVFYGAILSDVLRSTGSPEEQRRVQRRDDRRNVGQGRQVRIDRSVFSEQSRAGSHPQPTFRPSHREASLKYIFFPILTHVRSWVSDTVDNASCPIVAGSPERHQGGVHQGGGLLRDSEESSTSTPRCRSSSRRSSRAGCSKRLVRGSGSPRTRTTSRAREGWKALDAFETRSSGQGESHPRDGRGRGPRRDPAARAAIPLRSRAQPRNTRGVSGPRLPDSQRPIHSARSSVSRSLLQEGHRGRSHDARL